MRRSSIVPRLPKDLPRSRPQPASELLPEVPNYGTIIKEGFTLDLGRLDSKLNGYQYKRAPASWLHTSGAFESAITFDKSLCSLNTRTRNVAWSIFVEKALFGPLGLTNSDKQNPQVQREQEKIRSSIKGGIAYKGLAAEIIKYFDLETHAPILARIINKAEQGTLEKRALRAPKPDTVIHSIITRGNEARGAAEPKKGKGNGRQ